MGGELSAENIKFQISNNKQAQSAKIQMAEKGDELSVLSYQWIAGEEGLPQAFRASQRWGRQLSAGNTKLQITNNKQDRSAKIKIAEKGRVEMNEEVNNREGRKATKEDMEIGFWTWRAEY